MFISLLPISGSGGRRFLELAAKCVLSVSVAVDGGKKGEKKKQAWKEWYLRGVGLRARGNGSLCACLNDVRRGHHHVKLTCGCRKHRSR